MGGVVPDIMLVGFTTGGECGVDTSGGDERFESSGGGGSGGVVGLGGVRGIVLVATRESGDGRR